MLPELMKSIGDRFEAAGRAIGDRLSGRTIREGPWVPMAMVEDADDAASFQGPPLIAERMEAMAANFNVAQFAPPVITGKDGGSHWQGEYLDPLGHVVDVDFDGLTLWGRLSEIVDYGDGRIETAVSTGRWKRSIRFLYGSDPSATYLAHLALTGGEMEAQPGLLPLTHAFPDAIRREEAPPDGDELPASEADRFAPGLAVAERTFPAPSAPPAETHMDDTKLQELLGGLRTGIQSDLATGIAAAVAPIEARMTELSTQLTETRAAADRTASDARKSGYRTALDGFVREARMAPAETEVQLEAMMAVSPEIAEKMIGAIRTRPAQLGRYTREPLVVGEGANARAAESLMLGDPIREGEVSQHEAERFAEAVNAAGGPDAAKDNQKFMAGLVASGAHPLDGARRPN